MGCPNKPSILHIGVGYIVSLHLNDFNTFRPPRSLGSNSTSASASITTPHARDLFSGRSTSDWPHPKTLPVPCAARLRDPACALCCSPKTLPVPCASRAAKVISFSCHSTPFPKDLRSHFFKQNWGLCEGHLGHQLVSFALQRRSFIIITIPHLHPQWSLSLLILSNSEVGCLGSQAQPTRQCPHFASHTHSLPHFLFHGLSHHSSPVHPP